MKLVMLTDTLSERFGDKEAVRLIAGAGFDGYDFSMFSMTGKDSPYAADGALDDARELRAYADSLGIPCLQGHTPFGRLTCREDAERMVKLQERALRFLHILGCPIAVVHPGNNFTAEQNYEWCYRPLLRVAEELGMRIAAENMWNYDSVNRISTPAACSTGEDFCRHIDIAGSPYLVGCLDIGHAEMPGNDGAVRMIHALGAQRLAALHVHDNNCLDDMHTIPYYPLSKINWPPVLRALRDIGYRGNFTLEVNDGAEVDFLHRYPDELVPAVLKMLEQTGRYMIKQITLS